MPSSLRSRPHHGPGRPGLPSMLYRFAAPLGLAAMLLPMAVQATTISYIAGAFAQTSDGTNSSFAQQTSTTQTRTTDRGPGSVESVTASADLATGTLRQSTQNIINNSPNSQVAFGSTFIGDSFSHYVGTQPYQWTQTSTAQFRLHVDGNESLSGDVGNLYNFSIIALVIYQPGQMDSFLPFCGSTVIKSVFWTIGTGAPTTDPCGNPYLGNFVGNVNVDLVVPFTPAGDFSWAFGFKLGGAMDTGSDIGASANWTNDFGHTLTLAYDAPQGTTVQSSSGVFPGTTALAQDLPEPGSLALLALGLGALALRRRTG